MKHFRFDIYIFRKAKSICCENSLWKCSMKPKSHSADLSKYTNSEMNRIWSLSWRHVSFFSLLNYDLYYYYGIHCTALRWQYRQEGSYVSCLGSDKWTKYNISIIVLKRQCHKIINTIYFLHEWIYEHTHTNQNYKVYNNFMELSL